MAYGHHIYLSSDDLAGNGGLGRYVFLPGDRTRAAKIASFFDEPRVIDNPRGHTGHLGRLSIPGGEPIDVLSISSGMGCASVEIIVHELIDCGAHRILRVGSCGTLTSRIHVGDVVIVTAAVRDEGTTDHYAPKEFPAMAHPDAVIAMVEGAKKAGLAGRTFRGISHSKDSLYAREFGVGPAGARNREYMEWIGRAGCAVSEMEAAALFMLATAASAGKLSAIECGPSREEVQAGTVLAVYGGDDSNMKLDPKETAAAETRAIQVAIEGVRAWAIQDRVKG
jgi:uridine phosphorylase